MIKPWEEPSENYDDLIESVFKKYHRKIDAIILNINSNSLKESDKRKLKKQLIEKLNQE